MVRWRVKWSTGIKSWKNVESARKSTSYPAERGELSLPRRIEASTTVGSSTRFWSIARTNRLSSISSLSSTNPALLLFSFSLIPRNESNFEISNYSSETPLTFFLEIFLFSRFLYPIWIDFRFEWFRIMFAFGFLFDRSGIERSSNVKMIRWLIFESLIVLTFFHSYFVSLKDIFERYFTKRKDIWSSIFSKF